MHILFYIIYATSILFCGISGTWPQTKFFSGKIHVKVTFSIIFNLFLYKLYKSTEKGYLNVCFSRKKLSLRSSTRWQWGWAFQENHPTVILTSWHSAQFILFIQTGTIMLEQNIFDVIQYRIIFYIILCIIFYIILCIIFYIILLIILYTILYTTLYIILYITFYIILYYI